ncbi:hypothetical protein [Candidatus Pelagibacter sp.]|uniref:hypothetical protein n=1 Tax=Candidatus Pelagibacter sp. TaxID=2024849 RepID=UPI003F832B5B
MDKILFFSPYYTIIDWAKNNFFLKKKIFDNSEIRSIHCNSLLNKNCVAVMAHDNKYSTNQICFRCKSNRNFFDTNEKSFLLEDYIDDNDKSKIEKVLKKITKKNFLKFDYQGFKVGRISVHENFIKFRREDFNISDHEFKKILLSIENIIINIVALNKITKKFKPNILITENGTYSISRLYVEYFKKRGCKTYTVDGSPNNSKRNNNMHLYKNSTFEGQQYIKKNYEKLIKNQSIDVSGLQDSLNHFRFAFLSKALRNYSKKIEYKNVKNHFKIDKKQKVILLSTSSYDEVTGTSLLHYKNPEKKLIFSQEEAIKKTIKFVSKNKNYFLIIRQHPRDSRTSSVSKLLKSLKKLPSNVVINTSKDNMSVYNILLETDINLNSWSSVGLESSILGIPTFHLTDYFIHFPNFSNLNFNNFIKEKIQSFKMSNEAIIKAYQYIYFIR